MIRSNTTGTIEVTHLLIPGYYDVHLDGAPSCRVVFEADIEALDAAGDQESIGYPSCQAYPS
jgi:hypothetical protein